MKALIQRWLGISQLIYNDAIAHNKLTLIHEELDKLQEDDKINKLALGRIIAKLDPTYHISEDDPKRKEESDRLANKTISRLRAEFFATQHTVGR